MVTVASKPVVQACLITKKNYKLKRLQSAMYANIYVPTRIVNYRTPDTETEWNNRQTQRCKYSCEIGKTKDQHLSKQKKNCALRLRAKMSK